MSMRPPLVKKRISIYIPARYTLRAGRAEIGGFSVAMVLTLLLVPACLSGLGQEGALSAALLMLCVSGFCGVSLRRARKFSLTVDGERLTYHHSEGPPEEFTFRQVAWVRYKGEKYLLLDANRRELCRVSFNAQGLDILLADLRSRGAVLWDRREAPEAVVLSVSGSRWEEAEVDLPAWVPERYRLRNPAWLTALPSVCGALFLVLMVWMFQDGERILPLCVLPFFLMTLLAVILARREYLEVSGDQFHFRPAWGKRQSGSFSGVAAARIRTSATGLGAVSTLHLLDSAGEIAAAPGAALQGLPLLLADLAERGIPFTYSAD
ncbi:MAG: hypothetical protein HFG00_05930 [Oscillibacter sp.]|nr:hypothetical protein [Oscillibacter sp.]